MMRIIMFILAAMVGGVLSQEEEGGGGGEMGYSEGSPDMDFSVAEGEVENFIPQNFESSSPSNVYTEVQPLGSVEDAVTEEGPQMAAYTEDSGDGMSIGMEESSPESEDAFSESVLGENAEDTNPGSVAGGGSSAEFTPVESNSDDEGEGGFGDVGWGGDDGDEEEDGGFGAQRRWSEDDEDDKSDTSEEKDDDDSGINSSFNAPKPPGLGDDGWWGYDNDDDGDDDDEDDDEKKKNARINFQSYYDRMKTEKDDKEEDSDDDDSSEEKSDENSSEERKDKWKYYVNDDSGENRRKKQWYRNEYFDDYWNGENGRNDWLDDYFVDFDDSGENDGDNDSSDSKESSEERDDDDDYIFIPPYKKRLNRLQKYLENIDKNTNDKWRYNNIFWWRFRNRNQIRDKNQEPKQPGPYQEKYVPPPQNTNQDPPVTNEKINKTEPPSLKEIGQHPWDWVLNDIPPPDYGPTSPSVTPPFDMDFSTTPPTTWEIQTNVTNREWTVNNECNRRVDIVAMVDGKSNEADFELLKDSLTKLLYSMRISESRVRFGLVLNSNDATTRLPLVGDRGKLLQGVRDLTRPMDGRRSDKGLSVMRGMFRVRGRYGVPKVGLVILNDKTEFPQKTLEQAKRSRDEDVRVFTVGIGKQINTVEVTSIAYSPQYSHSLGDYKDLKGYISNLAKNICEMSKMVGKVKGSWGSGTSGGGGGDEGDPNGPRGPSAGRRRRQRHHGGYHGSGPCDGCKLLNGAAFNRHPTDCDKYVQCYFVAKNEIKAVYRDCPWGTFWNQTVLTCQDPSVAKCPNDPCVFSRGKIRQYRSKDSCRSYWQCNSHSHLKCCPPGERYEEDQGCVKDNGTCTDACPPRKEEVKVEPVVKEPVDVVGSCDKKPVLNKKRFYDQYVRGHGDIRMPCPPGTEFSPVDCACSIISVYENPRRVKGCQPEIIMDFEDGVRDVSGRMSWINNQGVNTRDGLAVFDGKNRILLPRFNRAEFGSTFIVRLRYKETGEFKGRSAVQALVNNGDCGQEGSIQIYTNNEKVGFVVKTKEEPGMRGMEIPKGTGWKEVEYAVIEGRLEGRVHGVAYTKEAKGDIETRNCALQIGYGFGYHNFVGLMDQIEIYKCKPEKKFSRS
ncbi:hypothetical protein FSP39_004698 [Pinctada imbricata]|uniref:Uncharacterized protein n=1 Tax=Pinctada imbricata TaxID=66713 RepID=A0AA89C556_PINIB|nr:hypothetical protein FSP39_004698 [Pinctada imbricata]